jgi:hypothetical protein
MPLPGEGEDEGEAGRGSERERPLRDSRAPSPRFDSRRLRHVSMKPHELVISL